MSDDTCPRCGGVLPAKGGTGPRPTYCSKSCLNASSYARRKAAGTLYKPPLVERRAIACADCGDEFTSGRSEARFCSRKCASAWGRKNESGECADESCGRPVRAKGLCNKHYKATLRADGRLMNPVWDDARRDAYHRRRALKKGASTGRFVALSEIAERDGWMCNLCAAAVDPELAWPDPMSKSLDHIEPLSLGGLHDPDNVQLAHLRCNTAKGNRVA